MVCKWVVYWGYKKGTFVEGLLEDSIEIILVGLWLFITLPETNIFAPENRGPLEKEIPIGVSTIFRWELLVSGRAKLMLIHNKSYVETGQCQ